MPKMVVPKHLHEYPNLIQKKEHLTNHSRLIQDTHTLLQGPPKWIQCPKHAIPILELIAEDPSLKMNKNVLYALDREQEPKPRPKISLEQIDNH